MFLESVTSLLLWTSGVLPVLVEFLFQTTKPLHTHITPLLITYTANNHSLGFTSDHGATGNPQISFYAFPKTPTPFRFNFRNQGLHELMIISGEYSHQGVEVKDHHICCDGDDDDDVYQSEEEEEGVADALERGTKKGKGEDNDELREFLFRVAG